MHPIRILAPGERASYCRHLLRLSTADRRLCFGAPLDDGAIEAHVERLTSPRDRILAHLGADLEIVGAVHVAHCRNDAAEFAFSVEAGHCGRGIGRALFARAVVFARNRGVRSAHIHCLAVNREMRRIARSRGMKIVTADGEGEGTLALPAATPATVAGEMLSEHAGLCDYVLKANRRAARVWRRGPRAAA